MAELKNAFTWSFSAAEDFEECRRKRYWSKYAKWGGWEARAPALQRKAYQLDKMDNRYSLQGNAVETAVMWVLREKQAGRDVTVDEAYREVARPFLNKAWKESRDKLWLQDPKHRCSLHEHYYPALHTQSDADWTAALMETTRRCIGNFIDRVLPRLAHVKPAQETPIAKPGSGGDPENFTLEGVKIYAIPDYVYREDDLLHIVDWKSGRAKPSHAHQLALYGLWANIKHGVDPASIVVCLEYLADGQTSLERLSREHLDRAIAAIGESVGDMTGYLVNEDRELNRAMPQDVWDLAAARSACRRCNFHELCEPELLADPIEEA